MIKTLEGVKVVSFARAAAGISCAKVLGEFGADVIFVEAVKGAALRKLRYNEFYLCGQKSVPVNLRDPRGMEFMHKLIEDADVFISNYRYKALQAMGLDYEMLHEKYPKLVFATINGYGFSGPMKDAPGFDITAFWARAGIINDVMDRGSQPLIAPAGMGDVAAGTNLAMGVVSALYKRMQTGEGMKVYTSLYNYGLYLNHAQIMDQQDGLKFPKTRKDPGRALKNSFHCSDGWVQMMTLDFDKDFKNILHIIHRDDLIGDPRWTCMQDTEGEKAIELTQILDEAFAKITVKEAVTGFESVDMACSAYYPGLFSTTDEQAEANKYFVEVTKASGQKMKVPVSPIKMGDDEPSDFDLYTPHLGENTVEVMKAYGYTDKQIQELIDEKVVVSNPKA